ncbi:multidrug effflux MFS transporter [Bacillus sp. ISL-18]|uniref:multidrug effflux MFS transporter n=1 Tax=Bacillus sp. ISL-18 TaxID=2819118 RepID=UPI001BEBDE38|nr:multidrug effflux MFS transporter [Bacillus sp. ISL-18]MBT2655044.1 multidrug effflux MFS transporter [Bacillus sp. ISL-18]
MNLKTENKLEERISTNSEKQIGIVIVLGFLSALAPFSMDMYLPALPTLTSDLHTSTSLAQLSLMFCLLGLAFGQLIAGPISDARGRRIPLIIGMVIFIVSSLLCAFTSSIEVLIILRLIQGLAGSVGLVISRAVVRDYYTGNKMTKFFALLMLVNGIAPIVAPIIGGQLLRLTSWQGIFLILATLGIGLLVGVIYKLPESLPLEKRQTGGIKQTLSSMQTLIRDRVFMGYVLSQGFIMAAMFAYISGSPFVLQKFYGISPQAYSAIFATNSIGIIFASQLSSKLCQRYGEKKVLVSGLILAGLGSLLLLMMIQVEAGLIGLLPPLFIVVSCVGLIGPASTSLAMERQGKHAGSASALTGLAQMGLGAIATPIVGLGGSNTATPMGQVIIFCTVCALLCYLVLVRDCKRGYNKA